MKLIVKEHVNKIAQPIVKKYTVEIDAVNSYNKIPKSIGTMKGDLIVFASEGNPVRFPAGNVAGKAILTDPTSETGWVLGDAGGAGGATATLYNGTGATLNAGTVVVTEPPASESIIYPEIVKATATSTGPYYVIDDNVDNGETVQASFAEGSVVNVLCDTSAVAQGDALAVSTTAGLATVINGTPTLGVAVSAKASGSIGLVKCQLVKAPTVAGINTDSVSRTNGQVYEIVEGSTTEDNPNLVSARYGKHPVGIQANAQSASAGTALLHSRTGDIAMVMADSTEIRIGDWLVPSTSTSGYVRNGNGYGIGYAMSAKESGSAGLVKCLIMAGQYHNSPRCWYLPAGINESQVVGAYQFIKRDSEASALQCINTETAYTLGKVKGTESWNTTTGFTIPASTGAGLNNTSIQSMTTTVKTGVFRFSGGYVGTGSVAQGGLSLGTTWFLQLNGARLDNDGTTVYYYHRPSFSNTNASDRAYYATAMGSGSQLASGVYGLYLTGTGRIFYANGTSYSETAQITQYTGFAPSGTPLIGQANKDQFSKRTFYVQAVVFYNTILTASQHQELATAMNAL